MQSSFRDNPLITVSAIRLRALYQDKTRGIANVHPAVCERHNSFEHRSMIADCVRQPFLRHGKRGRFQTFPHQFSAYSNRAK
jgi:hypothetical protein